MPLLSLLALSHAARQVTVTWQEARVDSVQLTAVGVEVEASVRDMCSFEIQNLWYFELYAEDDRPCSDWRPLVASEPERRLRVEPARIPRPIRGPVVAGERHSMTVAVTSPASLGGSTVGTRFEAATLILDGIDLGAALVLADLQRQDTPTLGLTLDGRLVVDGDAGELSWHAPNRRELVDAYAVALDASAFPLVAEEWRCAALTRTPPADYAALNEPGLLAGYAVTTCDAAAKAQGPTLCSRAAAELVGATIVAGEATRTWVEPVLEHCGSDFTNAAREHVTGHYAKALSRGDLADASRLVKTWGAEMGAQWTGQAQTQVDGLIRDQVPARFDWAIHNGAHEQARGLVELYGDVLGDAWVTAAEARIR